MNRSPILILVISILLFSCSNPKEEKKVLLTSVLKHDVEAIKWQSKADKLYNETKYDSAFYFYNKSKGKFELNDSKENLAYCLIQMARTQQVAGDYFGSETSLIEALPYIKENKQYLSAVNNLLGIAAKELKKYPEAIALWNDILKNKFLDTLPKKKAIYIDNIGYAYFKKGDNGKGLNLMNEALQIRLQQNDSYGSVESYLHLTDYYLENNKIRAKENATKAYQEATINNSIDERLKALLLLIKINPKQQYALKYASLNDSIMQVRNAAKNQFAKIRYDARLVNEENLKLKNKNIATDLQLQKSQNEKNIWISASALLISLLFILYNYLKNKNKLEKQKATYFTETKIAKKIHDEIANDVFQTMAFVETKKIEEQENKETLIHLLDNLYQRSRNISKENESIETDESFIENLIEMINSYKSTAQNIIIKKDEAINWMNLSEIKKITLFRVLQELLVNMKKHSEAGIVVLNFANNKNDVTIDYSDNGKGIKIDSIKKSGIANVENRIQNINGKITFDTTGNGLKVKINIPK